MNRITIFTILSLILACNNDDKALELYNQAVIQYINKDLVGAERLCIQSINESKIPEAFFLLSKIYYFTNNQQFESTIKKYIKYTHSSQGYTLYARWCIEHNNKKKAIENCNRALSHSPNDPIALYLLGTIYYTDKNYEDAIITFHKAFPNYFYLMLIHKQLTSIYNDIDLPERAMKHQKMIHSIEDFENNTIGE